MSRLSTVILDVDGVLLNLAKPFYHYCRDGVSRGRWQHHPSSPNPEHWDFGITDKDELNRLFEHFYREHEPLPMMDYSIPSVVEALRARHTVEIVTAYPDYHKRASNLFHHGIFFDGLHCNVNNKAAFISELDHQGRDIVAIVEDSPSHLISLLPRYHGKLWVPSVWNYVKPLQGTSGLDFYNHPEELLKIL